MNQYYYNACFSPIAINLQQKTFQNLFHLVAEIETKLLHTYNIEKYFDTQPLQNQEVE